MAQRPMRCGWPPVGSAQEPVCGKAPTIAYIVEVYEPDSGVWPPPRQRRVLALCGKHDPLSRMPPKP